MESQKAAFSSQGFSLMTKGLWDCIVKPVSPQDAAVWVSWLRSWLEHCYVVLSDVVCICPLAVQFPWYFCKFYLKSVSQSDEMGTQSGWRFSWLWASLDMLARCPVCLERLNDLKSNYLKCRWALFCWFSLEEPETSCPSKFQRYKNWAAWNSMNKGMKRVLLPSPEMKCSPLLK